MSGDADRHAARALLESSAIHWRRDWDALVIGFLLGVLATVLVGLVGRVLIGEETQVWTHDHPPAVEAR